MNMQRDTRRAALQALYQLDSNGEDHLDMIRESLVEGREESSSIDDGLELARQVWQRREDADAAVALLTPEWPTHRQPMIDRNVLRLGWYELQCGQTPPKVVIDEAIELAREFSTQQSPSFINGVLDSLWQQQKDAVGTEGTGA
ncbi:MAG: transcription antitermination factor NusB [Planctomycetota bacterium]|nr:transcription antitermination factor NusB [Planctomycetota bacterium]